MVSADEVQRLQTGSDPESKLAQKVFEQGHYAGRTQPSTTRQGIYATAPSGVMLASINSNDPSRVAGMLRQALNKWGDMSEVQRMLPGSPVEIKKQIRRAEDMFPADGLTLRIFSRDLPGGQRPPDWRADAWNQSFAWFRRSELQLPTGPLPKVGETVPMVSIIPRRLAKLNFLDNVRGQTGPFNEGSIKAASLNGTVESVKGSKITLKLSGESHTERTGRWSIRGFNDAPSPQRQEMKLTLSGRAVYDQAAGRFAEFELLAVGMRTGATQFNGRHDDPGPARIGFYATLTGNQASERVAPDYFGAYGWR